MERQSIQAIGLVGGLASGKNSFGDFISERKGGIVVTTSDVARRYIRENDLGETTRDLTREVASKLREENGTDYLLRKSIDEVPEDELVIVSGLYVVPEVLALRSLRKSIIVHVDASRELRADRVIKRARSSDESNGDNFIRLDNEDRNASVTDQRLDEVVMMSDFTVDGSVPILDEEYWSNQVELIFARQFEEEG